MTGDVSRTRLFEQLIQRETAGGFEPGEISNRVREVGAAVAPILNQVSRNFPEYTLHDPAHGLRVVENMGKLIPCDTLDKLNAVELSILIYAGYLHDIGMAANEQELVAWLQSEDGAAFLAQDGKWSDLMQAAERAGDQTARRRVEDMAFTDYLRLRHAQRGAHFVVDRFGPDGDSDHKIAVRQVNYAHLVAQIIASHGEDTSKLRSSDYRRDELVREWPVNLQYLGVTLRLSDLIDLDPERTPRTLLDFINPQNPRSAEEWSKHRSIQGWEIRDTRIRFRARCSHPAIQSGLRQWMDAIDHERRACLDIVRDNREEITARYQLNLDDPVPTDTIESDGSYIYGDFRFQLDYDKIISLLMGTQLWRDPDIALRELLQNAIDTCQHRQHLSKRAGLSYEPRITFSRGQTSNGSDVIVCEDNGMGMNTHIVQQYFMRIGRSYYTSSEFCTQNLDFQPISQFGLGIMSCFMLGERITVHTRGLSPDLQTLGQPLAIEIDGPSRYFVVREGDRKEPGTSVTVFLRGLRPPYRTWLRSRLPAIAPHPRYDISVHESGKQEVLTYQPHEIPRKPPWPWFSGHRVERDDLVLREAARYDFHLARADTGGLEGAVALLLLRDGTGKLAWSREEANVTVRLRHGNIEYRRWRLTSSGRTQGVEERGVIEPRGSGQNWSQDGIRVRGPFPVPSMEIPLPIPCFLDVDIEGPWKLSLNVTRTEFIADERLDQFRELFYHVVAVILRQVLEAERLLPDAEPSRPFVDELFRRSHPVLRKYLKASLAYAPAWLEGGVAS